jgi:hypothetical protein
MTRKVITAFVYAVSWHHFASVLQNYLILKGSDNNVLWVVLLALKNGM